MSLVIASLYANPLHVGHIEYLRRARELGHYLIVVVNTDRQIAIKGSRRFMNQEDRLAIVQSLKWVDEARLAVDQDGSVCETLKQIRKELPHEHLIFAKGGDRFANEIPEAALCRVLDIQIIDGLGAKIRASSEILEGWKS